MEKKISSAVLFTEDIDRIIKSEARKMVGTCGLQWTDFEDLCQELYFQVVKAVPGYRPEAGKFTAFAGTVAANHRRRIFRDRMRHGEDRPWVSLNELLSEREDCTRNAKDRKAVLEELTGRGNDGIASDVQTALGALPEQLRNICLFLIQGYSGKEAGEKLGIPLRTLRRRMAELKVKFGDFMNYGTH